MSVSPSTHRSLTCSCPLCSFSHLSCCPAPPVIPIIDPHCSVTSPGWDLTWGKPCCSRLCAHAPLHLPKWESVKKCGHNPAATKFSWHTGPIRWLIWEEGQGDSRALWLDSHVMSRVNTEGTILTQGLCTQEERVFFCCHTTTWRRDPQCEENNGKFEHL